MLAAADPAIGGVLLRGQKGSAKTTLARGLARLLADDAPFVELPIGTTGDHLVGSIDLAAALTGGEIRSTGQVGQHRPRRVPAAGAGRHDGTWRPQGLPALPVPSLSKGPTEAADNPIKRVKRVAFGFTRLRNYRIRTVLYAGRPN